MSTKIYHGLRLALTDLAEIDAAMQGLRAETMALVREKRGAFVANYATNILDRRALGIYRPKEGEKEDREPFRLAQSKLRKVEDYCYGGATQERGHEHAYPDLRLDLVFFVHEGRIYAIPFAEDEDFHDLVTKQGWVEEFGFWNNSDKPDHVSDAEWDHRREVWAAIFDKCYASIPSNGGYAVHLSPRQWKLVLWPSIQKHLKPAAERAPRLASDVVHSEWAGEQRAAAKAAGVEVDASHLVFGFRKAREEDPKWAARIAEETARITGVLIDEIKPEDLGFPPHLMGDVDG